LHDKDVAAMLQKLRGIASEIWLVPLRNERALTIGELRSLAASAGYEQIHESNLAAALAEAVVENELVLCAGSLFLAGEVLAFFEGLPAPLPSNQ
jgi:folylpolyglutamate synthase/dihydropteroate synthase